MPTAIPRPGFDPNANGGGVRALEEYYTRILSANPAFRPPKGYEIKNGRVVRDTHGKWDMVGKIGAAAGLGTMAYGGGQLAAGAMGGGGAAGSTAGSTATTGASGMPGWLNTLKGWLGIGANVGSVLGDMAGERGRAQEHAEGAQLTRDRLNLDRARYQDQSYMDRADMDLKRRTFEAEAPGRRLSTGMRASMMQNLQPRSGGPMTLSSGRQVTPVDYGTDPGKMIGPDARGLAGEVMKQILAQQGAGDKFTPIPDVQYPNPQGAPEGGILDKVLQIGSAVGNIGGAMTLPPPGTRRRRPLPPVTPDPYDPEL